MARGDAREGKWRGDWRMEWVASTLHTTSERGVSSITTADAHTSAASSRLNWRPCRLKWTRPFRGKTNSGFCACAITFQTPCAFYIRLLTATTVHVPVNNYCALSHSFPITFASPYYCILLLSLYSLLSLFLKLYFLLCSHTFGQ